MYDQTTSVELSHILHVVQKSVEFSGVGSLTHKIIMNTYWLRRRAVDNTKSRMYMMFCETI